MAPIEEAAHETSPTNQQEKVKSDANKNQEKEQKESEEKAKKIKEEADETVK